MSPTRASKKRHLLCGGTMLPGTDGWLVLATRNFEIRACMREHDV